MDASNELDHDEKRYKNQIEDYLYDVKENIDETNNSRVEGVEMQEIFKYNHITDNGDVNDENLQSSIILKLTVRQSVHSLMKFNDNDEQNIILSEKTDFKDLNPYESSPSLLSINNKSQDFMYQLSISNIECNLTSINLQLPQFVQNQIQSSNFFQQFWSPRIYSAKLIDSNTSENTLSILWSLIILLSKLIINGFYFCTKILRYDRILFSFCYLLGALFGNNVYFFIDFLLIIICVLSILVATYEKWLFRYINLNEYNNELTNTENTNRYWNRIKVVAYGIVIGTISTFFV